MAATTPYSHLNYKSYLKARIASMEEPWGMMTKLAKAAKCQRPYLSRVLSDKAHLSPPQLYGIARFWKLPEQETEYLLGLLEMERSSSASYREYWARKLADIKKKNEDLALRVQRKPASKETESSEREKDQLYYSAWYYTAIHILVSIPEFQTEEAIAEKLSLPPSLVRSVLHRLESWGSVRHERGVWKFGAREQHISKSSPLSVFHHMNWRNQAMLNAQAASSQGVHFTVVQSLSRSDFEKIKELVLETIQKAGEIAGPSSEEKLMCLACDFFEVGGTE